MDVVDAGELPNVPDAPGVYVVRCAARGSTAHRRGEILYVGHSNSLRRRVAYALAGRGEGPPHGAQRPLSEFQAAGGRARLACVPFPSERIAAQVESAILREFSARTGRLPAWNRAKESRVVAPPSAQAKARLLLDRLRVAARRPPAERISRAGRMRRA